MKRNSKSIGFKVITVENLRTPQQMVLQKEGTDLYNKLHEPCLTNTHYPLIFGHK